MSVPDAWGVPYYDVVSLCWLAYKENKAKVGDRWRFQTGSTWTIRNVYESGPFRAVLAEQLSTELMCIAPSLVLSFSGTDELLDWPDNISQGLTGVSGQYFRALSIAKSSPCQMVVGHSLGGGMASFVAIHTGKCAATVNPAALNIFVGLMPNSIPNLPNLVGILKHGSRVINYVVPGEALDILDKVSPSMTRVGKIIHVPSSGKDLLGINKHLLNYLIGFTPPTKI
ncbi:MAG: lipase family protein [Pyrinomonadaceae bacterium]|nr:lipase family protein [Pyrinomonadaceae bacterium]MCX7639177.1 lipase family protein [Pyrinomonadaceae bacterium]MDW8303602.1 hypothetical protein [Acidobacteriota bacterium]